MLLFLYYVGKEAPWILFNGGFAPSKYSKTRLNSSKYLICQVCTLLNVHYLVLVSCSLFF